LRPAPSHRRLSPLRCRRLMAERRLMRLRTADVAANVCIRDEQGAAVDPLQPVDPSRSRRSKYQITLHRSGNNTKTSRHWITSSARSNSDCGIVRPSALAVLRLMTSSNFVSSCLSPHAGIGLPRFSPTPETLYCLNLSPREIRYLAAMERASPVLLLERIVCRDYRRARSPFAQICSVSRPECC